MNDMDLSGKNKDKPEKTGINRKYKDSVFTDLFNTKDRLLDLYKTLHRDDMDVTVEDIEIITLNDVVVNNCRNDVAFRVKNRLMILTEHQSTINYNMPLRMLFYLANELTEHSVFGEDSGKALYQKKRIDLPAPEFYVVYTGNDENYKGEMYLSDAFGTDEFIELKVKIIREEDADTSLGGYLKFVRLTEKIVNERVAENESTRQEEIFAAVEEAIETCIQQGILVDYLSRRKQEVVNMFTTELSTEMIIKVREEEGRAEGRAEGLEEGRAEIILSMHKNGFSNEQITLITEKSIDEIERIIKRAEES